MRAHHHCIVQLPRAARHVQQRRGVEHPTGLLLRHAKAKARQQLCVPLVVRWVKCKRRRCQARQRLRLRQRVRERQLAEPETQPTRGLVDVAAVAAVAAAAAATSGADRAEPQQRQLLHCRPRPLLLLLLLLWWCHCCWQRRRLRSGAWLPQGEAKPASGPRGSAATRRRAASRLAVAPRCRLAERLLQQLPVGRRCQGCRALQHQLCRRRHLLLLWLLTRSQHRLQLASQRLMLHTQLGRHRGLLGRAAAGCMLLTLARTPTVAAAACCMQRASAAAAAGQPQRL